MASFAVFNLGCLGKFLCLSSSDFELVFYLVPMVLMTKDDQFTREEDISLSVVDKDELKDLEDLNDMEYIEDDTDEEVLDEVLPPDPEALAAKEKRKDRVMGLLKEEGLDSDPDLMKAVEEAFDGRLDMD